MESIRDQIKNARRGIYVRIANTDEVVPITKRSAYYLLDESEIDWELHGGNILRPYDPDRPTNWYYDTETGTSWAE